MMAKTMVICGYGPGISQAVAKRFGREGYALALVARSDDKLAGAVKELAEAQIVSRAFVCELGDATAVRELISNIRASMGPIGILHWNAYSTAAADVTTSKPEELRIVFDVGVTGCVVAVQQALADLKSQRGAVLVTGSGFASFDDQIDSMIVEWNEMGLALMKAAQRKLVGILHKKLAPEGIFVGQILVLGTVRGTPFHSGGAGIEPAAVAEQFWSLFSARDGATAVCRVA